MTMPIDFLGSFREKPEPKPNAVSTMPVISGGLRLRPGDMDEMLKLVPTELLARLEPLRTELERSGTIIEGRGHRTDTYSIRYRAQGGRQSITFSGHAAAYVLRVLLGLWRHERKLLVQAEREAKKREVQQHRQWVREMKEEAIRLGGGGGRRRRRIVREFNEAAAQGPKGLWLYQLTQPYLRPDPPPGRPRKGAMKLSLEGKGGPGGGT